MFSATARRATPLFCTTTALLPLLIAAAVFLLLVIFGAASTVHSDHHCQGHSHCRLRAALPD